MTSTIYSTPGSLNIVMRRGDDFSTSFDFSTTASGVTASSTIVSAVTGATVSQIATSVIDAGAGQIRISMTPTQSAALATGTYRWQHTWDYDGDSQKTMLIGFVEVVQ